MERETRGATSSVHVALGLPPAALAQAWPEPSAPPLLPGHPLPELLPTASAPPRWPPQAREEREGSRDERRSVRRPHVETEATAVGGGRAGGPRVSAGPHGLLSVPLLLSSVPRLPAPQVDEAQRRMDAEIWQLLSSFAAQPPAPPQRLSPHPQPAAALQAAPPSSPSSSPSSFSPSSSAFSASLSSAAGAQVCAKSPIKGPLPQAPRFQLSLNQRHKFCPFLHPTWTDIYSHFFFLYTNPVPAHLC